MASRTAAILGTAFSKSKTTGYKVANKNPAKDFCKNPAKDFCYRDLNKNPAKDFCSGDLNVRMVCVWCVCGVWCVSGKRLVGPCRTRNRATSYFIRLGHNWRC
jgi:hypothetical protein